VSAREGAARADAETGEVMENQRAYALFQVKALDSKRRTFSGVATTPSLDRVGDTVNPLGARFRNPLVLLHQHNREEPIGSATLKKPTAKGIDFDAQIPIVEEPGLLKDRVDMAWGEIKYEIVRAVSIGFKPIKYNFTSEGGVDYDEIEIYELSMVSIPALPDAVISAVKCMDGRPLPRDVIRSIRLADARERTVKLVQVRSNVGAVRLTK
jgi:HK97 family phage prohead protease